MAACLLRAMREMIHAPNYIYLHDAVDKRAVLKLLEFF